MAKRERNARALQDEVSRRIQRIDDIVEDGARIQVPRPAPHPRDARGRNWDIPRFAGAGGYERAIRVVVDKLRDEFDLNDDSAPERGGPVDPFSAG